MKAIVGRLVRVYLSHPLHDGTHYAENLKRALMWKGLIDSVPGLMCWAPWLDLALSNPDDLRSTELSEGRIMDFCKHSMQFADVGLFVGVVTERQGGGTFVTGISSGQWDELSHSGRISLPVVSIDRTVRNSAISLEIIRSKVREAIQWPG